MIFNYIETTQSCIYSAYSHTTPKHKIPPMPMGVLTQWSAHTRPCSRPPIDICGNLSAHKGQRMHFYWTNMFYLQCQDQLFIFFCANNKNVQNITQHYVYQNQNNSFLVISMFQRYETKGLTSLWSWRCLSSTKLG